MLRPGCPGVSTCIDFGFPFRGIFLTNFSLAKLIQIEVKRSSTIL
jgi:hypothetical protein